MAKVTCTTTENNRAASFLREKNFPTAGAAGGGLAGPPRCHQPVWCGRGLAPPVSPLVSCSLVIENRKNPPKHPHACGAEPGLSARTAMCAGTRGVTCTGTAAGTAPAGAGVCACPLSLGTCTSGSGAGAVPTTAAGTEGFVLTFLLPKGLDGARVMNHLGGQQSASCQPAGCGAVAAGGGGR